jgi:hypothetical protein
MATLVLITFFAVGLIVAPIVFIKILGFLIGIPVFFCLVGKLLS